MYIILKDGSKIFRTDLTEDQAEGQYKGKIESIEASDDPYKYTDISILKGKKKVRVDAKAKEEVIIKSGDLTTGLFKTMKAAKILNKVRKNKATAEELVLLDDLETQADEIESIQTQAAMMKIEIDALTDKQAVLDYVIAFTE